MSTACSLPGKAIFSPVVGPICVLPGTMFFDSNARVSKCDKKAHVGHPVLLHFENGFQARVAVATAFLQEFEGVLQVQTFADLRVEQK